VLVGIFVSLSNSRFTLNRVMSCSFALLFCALSVNSSTNYRARDELVKVQQKRPCGFELTRSILPGLGRKTPTIWISKSDITAETDF